MVLNHNKSLPVILAQERNLVDVFEEQQAEGTDGTKWRRKRVVRYEFSELARTDWEGPYNHGKDLGNMILSDMGMQLESCQQRRGIIFSYVLLDLLL